MRKRGRPLDEVTDSELRDWLELEVDGVLERMRRAEPRDQRAWLVSELADVTEFYATRRARWLRASTAQDVFEEVLDVVERVARGDLKHDMQAMLINRKFNDRDVVVGTDLFVAHGADTPERVRELGGCQRWAMRLVSRAMGVSMYAMQQHRRHRIRLRAGVVDTLATPVEPDEEDDDDEQRCIGW